LLEGNVDRGDGMRHWMCGGLLLVGLVLSSWTSAASLSVQVTDRAGKPVADAVVTVLGAGPRAVAVTRIVDQKQLTFLPYVEVFHPGDSLVFRNSDGTRHHVYSFSPAKQFELVVDANGRSAPLLLDKTGVVAVGCNIHDGMISYLYVTDAPYAARTDGSGRVSFEGLPAGSFEVRVWQPRLPPGRPDLRQQSIVLAASEKKAVDFQLTLRPDSRRQFDREHTHY
jgi:plastocyanin